MHRSIHGAVAGRTYISIPNWLVYGAALLAAAVLFAAIGAGVYRLVEAARARLLHRPAAPRAASWDISHPLLYSLVQDGRSTVKQVSGRVDMMRVRDVAAGDDLYAGAVASPDGERVVYLHAGCPRCFAGYEVKDLVTGTVRVIGGSPLRPPLTDAPREVAWSADGRQLAFVEQDLDSPQPRLFVLDMQRGERRVLASSDPDQQDNPVWSPSGRTVAYLAGGDDSVVSTVDVATGAVRRLNDQLAGGTGLTWSPDGRYLSVLRAGQIWLIDASDGHGFQLPAPGNLVQFGGWTPDASSVLAVIEERVGLSTERTVVTVPVRGGSVRRLATGPDILSARWSTDGLYMAWTAGDGRRWSITVASYAGAGPRRIAGGAGSVVLDDW